MQWPHDRFTRPSVKLPPDRNRSWHVGLPPWHVGVGTFASECIRRAVLSSLDRGFGQVGRTRRVRLAVSCRDAKSHIRRMWPTIIRPAKSVINAVPFG